MTMIVPIALKYFQYWGNDIERHRTYAALFINTKYAQELQGALAMPIRIHI
jgi:hypothetical protein